MKQLWHNQEVTDVKPHLPARNGPLQSWYVTSDRRDHSKCSHEVTEDDKATRTAHRRFCRLQSERETLNWCWRCRRTDVQGKRTKGGAYPVDKKDGTRIWRECSVYQCDACTLDPKPPVVEQFEVVKKEKKKRVVIPRWVPTNEMMRWVPGTKKPKKESPSRFSKRISV